MVDGGDTHISDIWSQEPMGVERGPQKLCVYRQQSQNRSGSVSFTMVPLDPKRMYTRALTDHCKQLHEYDDSICTALQEHMVVQHIEHKYKYVSCACPSGIVFDEGLFPKRCGMEHLLEI